MVDQKKAVRSFIEAGIEAGTGPQKIAREIVGTMSLVTSKREGGILGLTSQQTDYVIKARAELANPKLMANYLNRERRDRRFDKIVTAALASGKPVSASDIDRIVQRYKDRLLQLRGDTIARTEGITALRAGRHEGYQQLVESGKVRADQVIRTWRSAHDSRTRIDHLSLDKTEIRGLDQPFTAPDGSLLAFPGDTSLGATARETIQCRCHLDYQIDRRGMN